MARRTHARHLPRIVPGLLLDTGVAALGGVFIALVIARGRFSERVPFDALWERSLSALWAHVPHPLLGLPLVAVGAAVLGAALFRWLRSLWRKAQAPPRPRLYALLALCACSALLLHVAFVEWDSGLYQNGATPAQAWFGVVGEVSHAGMFREVREHMLRDPSTEAFYRDAMFGYCKWFGPQFPSMNHGDLLCFLGGILAPMALVAAAVLLLARELKRSSPAGKELS